MTRNFGRRLSRLENIKSTVDVPSVLRLDELHNSADAAWKRDFGSRPMPAGRMFFLMPPPVDSSAEWLRLYGPKRSVH
jgi:hypothetical protein